MLSIEGGMRSRSGCNRHETPVRNSRGEVHKPNADGMAHTADKRRYKWQIPRKQFFNYSSNNQSYFVAGNLFQDTIFCQIGSK